MSTADHLDALDPLDALLREARAAIDRLSPHRAAHALASGALLVDIRPDGQRRREGEIPGSIIIDRNVLEWRLAPTSPHRIPELLDDDQVVIVFCSAGYASSLAAASLQRAGLTNATDLVGGFLAWEAAGYAAVPYRHADVVDRTEPRGHLRLAAIDGTAG